MIHKKRKTISFLLAIILLINTIFLATALGKNNKNVYTNINAEEAWQMLNDTSNGIQIPIDVRTDAEWANKHIKTPYPEYPRHHCSCAWNNESILQKFITLYEGKEIILYCKSGVRSLQAASTLVENNFEGTIYNMVGGITEWENKDYPTVGNRPPGSPSINGS
ncbi:MAG: rhodanese-like domain-containing protein, partial [Candidatus Thermoplasmatota archaeon]